MLSVRGLRFDNIPFFDNLNLALAQQLFLSAYVPMTERMKNDILIGWQLYKIHLSDCSTSS